MTNKDILKSKVYKRNPIKTASGRLLETNVEGAVNLGFGSDMTNVIYSKDLDSSLLSVYDITKQGLNIVFDKNNAYIISETDSENLINVKGRAIVKGGGMYSLNFPIALASLKSWHERLGHLNSADILRLSNNTKGINLTNTTHAS